MRTLTREPAPSPVLPGAVGPAGRPVDRASTKPGTRLVDVIVDRLQGLGVEHAFGLIGGAVAPLGDALSTSGVRLLHCRHESGAAFAAAEASLASGRPSAVFFTTGPGLINGLNGLYAARKEGATVIVLSAITPAELVGRGAFQETGRHLLPADLYESGPLFHVAETVHGASQLEPLFEKLRLGVCRPEGFVAHLALPTTEQSELIHTVDGPVAGRTAEPQRSTPRATGELVDRVARELLDHRCVLWIGFGARSASKAIRAIAERLDVPVISTPRGKGIFPEQHRLYAGVTGFAGHASVHGMLDAYDPESILVLGSRLGEFSSMWEKDLERDRGFLQVDVDRANIGAAYPEAPTLAIEAEIGVFLDQVLDRIREKPVRTEQHAVHTGAGVKGERQITVGRRAQGAIRPRALMDAIQQLAVDRHDALILSDVGNAFAWTTHCLRFHRPGRFRLSTSWGSMGQAAAGALGAALCASRKVVAIVGDGAMLMNNEVSTAVQYGVAAVWVVLNDSQYGMIEHGMKGSGFASAGVEIPSVDFAKWAESLGATGLRISCEQDLDRALEIAIASSVPFVLDVVIDPGEAPPLGSRVEKLREQGVEA